MKTKNNKENIDLGKKLFNGIILTVFGVILLVFWFNNNQKIDLADLTKVSGVLVDYKYRYPMDRGTGYESKELFLKIKGYKCEFNISTDYERFEVLLNDTLNTIVTYIEPLDKIKLDKGVDRIQILGLKVNSTWINKIEDYIGSRNFMMTYVILILGVASCIIGFFDFRMYLKMKKNNKLRAT